MVKLRAPGCKRSPQKLTSRVKRHETGQTRKSRQQPRWRDLYPVPESVTWMGISQISVVLISGRRTKEVRHAHSASGRF